MVELHGLRERRCLMHTRIAQTSPEVAAGEGVPKVGESEGRSTR